MSLWQKWVPDAEKCFWRVKLGRCIGLTTLSPSVSRLSRQCGTLNISELYRPPRSVTGIALLFRVPGFDEVVDLERGPLSLVSTIEELLGRKSSGSGLEIRECGPMDLSHWLHDSLYPQKLSLTSATSGCLSVSIIRLRTKATKFNLVFFTRCLLNLFSEPSRIHSLLLLSPLPRGALLLGLDLFFAEAYVNTWDDCSSVQVAYPECAVREERQSSPCSSLLCLGTEACPTRLELGTWRRSAVSFRLRGRDRLPPPPPPPGGMSLDGTQTQSGRCRPVIFNLWNLYPRGCEKTFLGGYSKTFHNNQNETKNRLNLEPALILALTKIRPRTGVLACQKQGQSSH
jgi:hypothetical protein